MGLQRETKCTEPAWQLYANLVSTFYLQYYQKLEQWNILHHIHMLTCDVFRFIASYAKVSCLSCLAIFFALIMSIYFASEGFTVPLVVIVSDQLFASLLQ